MELSFNPVQAFSDATFLFLLNQRTISGINTHDFQLFVYRYSIVTFVIDEFTLWACDE